MNLKPLFELQKTLDERIVKEKGLEGQDLLPKKILALQVELGELANEWRGFKFWSEDQEPSIPLFIQGKYENRLLEEYVDCLHFILSIGLEREVTDEDILIIEDEIKFNAEYQKDMTEQFKSMFHYSTRVMGSYLRLFNCFVSLGEMLGFTWEQIEQAYMDKNKVNHERQSNGY